MLPPDVLEAQPSGKLCELVKQWRTGQTDNLSASALKFEDGLNVLKQLLI